MGDTTDRPGGDAPEQGMDEDVVVTGDAGTVSGLGPQAALDDAEDAPPGGEDDPS